MDPRTPVSLIALVLILLGGPLHRSQAQLAHLDDGWKSEPVTTGITWRQQQFDNLFNAPQHLNLLVVDLAHHTLQFVALTEVPRTVSEIASDYHAPAAVNGTYYDLKTLLSTTFIKVNGKVISRPSPHEPRQRAALVIDPKGKLDIIRRPEDTGWTKVLPYRHMLASSPVLVTHRKPWNHAQHEYGDVRHPRTAAGITPDNRLLLLTVDGRGKTAAGMSYTELAQCMAALGCERALCLDGGGSTTMWLKDRGVVNQVSDRSLIKRKPLERPVANAILVRPRLGPPEPTSPTPSAAPSSPPRD